MENHFFERPILNSPYEYPARHWELDEDGQPTQQIVESRRRAEFITPIPKPRKRKKGAAQAALVFNEGVGVSTEEQQYEPTPIINDLRNQVDRWRQLADPNHWQVTPETQRLLQHWRHHKFESVRPFFCQIEAVETAIWLTEVAPKAGKSGKGFVYERVPHITLKSIANNTEIDVIWDEYQSHLEPLREKMNAVLKKTWQDWEIPRDAGETCPQVAKDFHAEWWKQRINRQQKIDASIAAKADFEFLYDNPYEDNKKVRVAGPFTVESLSPHRVLAVDEAEELFETTGTSDVDARNAQDFVQVILDTLKASGVQQAHREDKITFSSISPWPGDYICADGRYTDSDGTEKRAAIFVGPEFGTVSRPNLVSAAKESGDAGFDVLITCAFNYDAHSSEFNKLGRIPVLKARMNADLHMAGDLKNTGKGNLFVIFGEPDIETLPAEAGQVRVKVNGVDVFKPNLGKVESCSPDELACWFIDTDYNEESFFVRHAYFLGANDPYKSLKTTLKAEINEEAWESLHSYTSRPFDNPSSGRIAVKVINHLGDEVMKVFRVN